MKSQSFKTIKKFASRFGVNRRGRLRRMLLTALVTGSSLVAAASSGLAEEGPPVYSGGISILVHEFNPGLAADATSVETQDIVATTTRVHRTSSQFNQIIAAAVTASAARIGIPVEQFLEPFAMVGHLGQPSPESSPYPARPTESAPLATTPLEESPAAEMETELASAPPSPQQQIDDIAALDCWWLGDDEVEWIADDSDDEYAFLTEVAESGDEAVTEIASVDGSGIGSAPVIVTIPDAYFPYDIARRDLELEFLPLSTIQPIRAKNYVSLSEPPNIDIAADVATDVVIGEPAITVSPDCVLDELIHSVSKFTERNHLGDLTLTKLGESAGNLFASTFSLSTDGSARRELALSTDGSARPELVLSTDGSASPELVLSPIEEADAESDGVTVDEQLVTRPVDEVPQPIAIGEEAAPEVSPVQIANGDTEAPEVNDVAATDTETMDVTGEQILAPVADEASNVVASDQIVTDATDAPTVDEVVIAEIVLMEVDGINIPAPIADEVPNAVESVQLVTEELEEAPASVQIAVASIVIIDENDEATSASIADEALDAKIAEQLVANDAVIEEVAATATDELTPIAPIETFSLAQVIDTINQWQQQAMATILSARDVSSLPSTAVAEKADATNENVVR